MTTLGLAAQEPGSESTTADPARPAESSAASPGKKIATITGCVQRLDKAGGGSGAAGIPAPTDSTATAITAMVLVKAKTSPAGTSGSTAAGASAATAGSYRLEGTESALAPHVGQRVEITGTVVDAADSAAPGAARIPTLRVDTVKMLSSTCPE